MIIKGNSCAGGRRLAVHLQRTDTNERAEVLEIRGLAAEDLKGALLEMEAVTAGSRCNKPFYHASIDPRADERLTPEQRDYAIQQLAEKLGLSDQPRVVVGHIKDGREHYHIVFGRYDAERMRTISDSHNYRKHEEVARHLEREFGHERVQGAHVERDGKPRPDRTPSHSEMLQADRTGLTSRQVKEQITEIWQRTDTGSAFAVALWQEHYVLCRGDRRDFVVIDPLGGTHSLARCVEGAKTKDIRGRMADLDPTHLPSVNQGKEYSAERRHIYMAQEQDRLDHKNSRKTGDPSLDWADSGGMQQQQKSALDWVKAAHEYRPARGEPTDQNPEHGETAEFAKQRRQAIVREFGRDLDHEPGDRERGQGLSRR